MRLGRNCPERQRAAAPPFTPGRVLRNTHADHWLGREIDLLQQIEAEAARYSAARERENLTSALAREIFGLAFAHETNFVIEGTGETVQPGKQ
jgi:hypothetical protein